MNEISQSCLVSRLSRFVDLNDQEREFIAQVEKDEQHRSKGRPVVGLGDQTDGIMVLKSGWAVVVADSAEGRSQILRIYLPAEIVGLAEIGLKHASHRIVMQTDGVVCPFPRKGLASLITDYPRLAALLIAVGNLDQIALRHLAVL
jgi:CRP-like cAMP-binding protein